MVAIFDEAARLVEAARAEVDAEHWLDADLARPVDEFVGAERVGLGREPGQIEPARTIRHGPDAVFPIIARQEIAAGIAHDRDAELLRQIGDVLAEPFGVRARMARLEYAGIDAPSHMFDEGAEDTPVDIRNGEVAINDQAG